MWDYLAGAYLAAAVLLVAAGVPKVADPRPLVRAARGVGIPLHRSVVRVLAVGEVALGLAAVVWPGPATAALVALSYAVFTAFVVRVRVAGGVLSSCGCFGKADTPPTVAHVVVTGVAAVAAGLVAAAPPAAPWSGAVLETVLLAAASLLVAFLAWAVLAVLPTTTPAGVRSTGQA